MPLLTPAHPDWPKLFLPSAPVTDFATQVSPYVGEMRRLMERKKRLGGYAMSGCQVGAFHRFFIFGGKYLKSGIVHTISNPTSVTRFGDPLIKEQEGCLSFQDRFVEKERWPCVSFTYENWHGEPQYYCTHDPLLARILQHELDHLDGITLFEQEPAIKI